jgi:hypothetical protein
LLDPGQVSGLSIATQVTAGRGVGSSNRGAPILTLAIRARSHRGRQGAAARRIAAPAMPRQRRPAASRSRLQPVESACMESNPEGLLAARLIELAPGRRGA